VRRAFLDALHVTCSVEQACHTAGIARSAAYRWRDDDPAFRDEWESVIDGIVDEAHGKMLQQARDDDGPAGVAARQTILRAYRPETFNRGLALRHEMMRLAIEEKRLALNAPLTIEGQVIDGGNKMLSEFRPINVTWLPNNGRIASPHLPADFNGITWHDQHPDEPLPLQPYPQDGSGMKLALPAKCVVCTHGGKEGLPVVLSCDGHRIAPQAATDLWRRIRDYNTGLILLREAIDPAGRGELQPPAATMPEPPDTEPPDTYPEGPEDDSGELDWHAGFGRP
jgi:hypothetical protein